MGIGYQQPEPIDEKHNLENFNCENQVLNDWLKNRAVKGEKNSGSRAYVVCTKDNQVIAYYCLASGSLSHAQAPGKVRRNMPKPIPIIILGRLAVDINHRNKGIGKGLVKDAIKRSIEASKIIGIKAILVHAIDENAKNFYLEKCGFMTSPANSFTLMLTIKDAELEFL